MLSIHHAYHVKFPLLQITLWHGIIIEMGLCHIAHPTACAEIVDNHLCLAIFWDISLYVIVCQYWISNNYFQTDFLNSVHINFNGIFWGYGFLSWKYKSSRCLVLSKISKSDFFSRFWKFDGKNFCHCICSQINLLFLLARNNCQKMRLIFRFLKVYLIR